MTVSKEYVSYLEHKVAHLEWENKNLKDSKTKRNDWLRQAKEDAGYDQNTSFDDVWDDALKRFKMNCQTNWKNPK